MSLFENQFFPTPKEVTIKMVEPYLDRLHNATILEPSAGSGSILEVIMGGIPKTIRTKRGQEYTADVTCSPERTWCIEKNPELQMLLQQKGFRLVAEDFLTYQPDIRYDLILMNPPFQQGDLHLLHAWEIIREGDIACLLNAETIRNPYTATRQQLARIIQSSGTVENLGRCFSSADNPTDVEVVLVRLHKGANDKAFDLNLDNFEREPTQDFSGMTSNGDALEQSSRLDAFIRAWDMAKSAALDFIKAREALSLYVGALLGENKGTLYSPVVELEKHLTETANEYKGDIPGHMKDGYNWFISCAKRQAWNTIFNQIGLDRYMTANLRQKLNDYQQAQGSFALTKENIMQLFSFIMTNIGTIMDEAVVEVYDMFTRFYKDNTAWKEGWKTNKQFSCNRKIVLPGFADAGFMPEKYGYRRFFSYDTTSGGKLDDIDKAMCWLSGRSFESLNGEIDIPGQGRIPCPENSTIKETLCRIGVGDQSWHESAFFRVKAFKKGTIHIEFKDEALWAKFNLTVNNGKNIIGDSEAA